MKRDYAYAAALIVVVIILDAVLFFALAEQRTTYDAQSGKAITRETIDSQGTRTTYDAQTGRVITRESTDSSKRGSKR